MLSGAVYGELHQRIKARIVCSRARVCCRWGMAWVGVYKSNSQTLGDMPQQLLVVAFLALCFRGVQCDYCNGYQSSREFQCELGSETCCGSSDITDSGTYYCYCVWDGSTDWCQYSCTRCQQCNYVSCVECGTGTYTAGCSGGSSGYCASCGTPPSGEYWSSGCTSSACTSCPANQYTSGCGGTSAGSCAGCSYCSTGQYNSGCGGTSSGTCTASTNKQANAAYTSHGSYSNSCPWGCVSGYSGSTCALNCPAGQTGSPCAGCSVGSYKSTTDSVACTTVTCGAGSYRSSATGCTTSTCACATCTIGNYCPAGSITPIPCPAGSYCAAAGLSVATVCPGGTYSATVGATSVSVCGACAAGTYRPSYAVSLQGLHRSCGAAGIDVCSATQSTTYGSYVASSALDDDLSTFSTTDGANGWWMLDFTTARTVSSATMWGRQEVYSGRFSGAQVWVGTQTTYNGAGNTNCFTVPAGDPLVISFTCSAVGRYFIVYLPGGNTYLNLADVEVWGLPVNSSCTPCPSHTHSEPGAAHCTVDAGYIGPTIYFPFLSSLGNAAMQAGLAVPVSRATFTPVVQSNVCDSSPVCRTGAYFPNKGVSTVESALKVSTAYNAPMTVSYWAKVKSTSSTQCALSLNDGTSIASHTAFNVADRNGEIYIFTNLGSWGCGYSAYTGSASTGALWHHVVYTISSEYIISRYIDGVLRDSSGACGGNLPMYYSVNLNLGSCQAALQGFQGWLSDVRMYRVALSAAQVTSIYASSGAAVVVQCPGSCGAQQTLHCSTAGVSACCSGGQYYGFDAPTAQQYPPSPTSGSYAWAGGQALTNTLTVSSGNTAASYGLGAYTVKCSSSVSVGGSNHAGAVFNYVDNEYVTMWYPVFTGAYPDGSGEYGGSNALKDNKGEWVYIQLPVSVVLTGYVIRSWTASPTRAPQRWSVLGSSDGQSWAQVDAVDYTSSNYPYDTASTYSSSQLTATVAYSYLALVVTAIHSSHESGSGLNFQEWQLFGYESTQICRRYPPYPTAGSYTWTGGQALTNTLTVSSGNTAASYGLGAYTVKCSSSVSVGGSNHAGAVFNYVDNDYTAIWYSDYTNTYGATGGYFGSKTLGGKSGEWVSIQLPVSIVLTHYAIKSCIGAPKRAPQQWSVLGSSDGQSWTQIDGMTYAGYPYATFPVCNSAPLNNAVAYSYFALVVKAVGNPPDSGSGLNFQEWQLFGYEPSSSCTACATGTYSNAGEGTSCTDCAVGYYCPSTGASAPVVCPVGSYCPSARLLSPVTCPVGSYCPSTGMSTPTTCPAGSVCATIGLTTGTQCSVGNYCPAGAVTQTQCSSGTYCPVGSTAANACAAGSYCATTASQVACPAGSYCVSTGLTVATQCAAGSYCATVASQVACPTGTYCPSAGLTVATQCAAGYYCATVASQVTCSTGKYCPTGSTTQNACALGSYCENTASQVQCPIGSTCAATGLTAPTPCPAGTYGTGVGRTSASACTVCNAGTYSTSLGLTASQS